MGLPDDAVRALTELLGDGVALVDDEVLVEDLEDLAPREIGHLVAIRRRRGVNRRELRGAGLYPGFRRCGAVERLGTSERMERGGGGQGAGIREEVEEEDRVSTDGRARY